MPIGFAIFITAVIVSVLVILIYHFVIIGTNNDGGSGGGGYGYNYDVNIAYLNTLTEALAVSSADPLGTQLGYNKNNFPELPGGSGTFRNNLSKP